MTSLPFVVTEEARGIVVRAPAAKAPRPVRVWAYMWAADDDEAAEHWHEKVTPDGVGKLVDEIRTKGEAALSGCHLHVER